MKISQIYQDLSRPHFSFEFFPPKTAEGEKSLFTAIRELKHLHPDFVSITYGAGGSTKPGSVKWADFIKNDINLETMAHLTCMGSAHDEIADMLVRLNKAGIENILALRGDPPKDMPAGSTNGDAGPALREYQERSAFPHASDLINFIKSGHVFSIGAAAYPEIHPEAESASADIGYLLLKQNQGAEFFITQLFFTNQSYFDFLEKTKLAGIHRPIIPGIMPITNSAQIQKFSSGIGAKIPAEFLCELHCAGNDEDKVASIGLQFAVRQCRELLQRGVPGIHFYTLNRSSATKKIMQQLI